MPQPRIIALDSTVRQIAIWPECAEILHKYDTARWGQRWSLQELEPFARHHQLDPQQFVAELADAAGATISPTIKTAPKSTPVRIISIALVVGLTLGAGWGVILLLQIAFGTSFAAVSNASVHVHGVAQLWGWMAMFVFAVGTYLLRQNTKKPSPAWLEQTAAMAVVVGLICFFIGLNSPIRQHIAWIDLVGSTLLLIASILFSTSVLWSLHGRGQKPLLWHRFVLSMIGWLWIWAITDWVLRFRGMNLPVLSDYARSLLIDLSVLGFALNAIYGFGIRLVPGLLNMGKLKQNRFNITLIVHNAGLVLLLLPWSPVKIVGAAAMLTGALIYISTMDYLRSKPSREIFGIDPRGHILIRVAFFWLVAGLGMVLIQQVWPQLPHAFAGAWRHALTVGFITTMILGVAQRMLPVFIKQPLASNPMMLTGAALIIIGNTGRVSLELATMGGWPWAFGWMGTTGLLELSALILFAINLIWTVRNQRHVYRADEPLRADTHVRQAINAKPVLQYRLCQLGVTMLDDTPFVAPSMTFGAMALAWGKRPRELLTELSAPVAPAGQQTV
ncbi:MAG: NnrS family protein [Phycisphaerales bacterium]|nr:NnrS family protein [Phycisphaerales bacterium]